jgi:hypothetical protein
MMQFVATWLFVWALLLIVYLGVLQAIDLIAAAWCRFEHRWRAACEVARIENEASGAMQRIDNALNEAQRKLRAEKRTVRAAGTAARRGGAR